MDNKKTGKVILVDIKTALKINAVQQKALRLAKKTIIENSNEISNSLMLCFKLNTTVTQTDIAKFENTKSYYLSRLFYIEAMLLTHQLGSSISIILLNKINREAEKLISKLCSEYTTISNIYALTIREILNKHK